MSRRALPLVVLLVGASLAAAPVAGDATASIDDSSLPLAAAEQQVITGQTSLEPGSQVTVRLRSADAESPFLKQPVATVDRDGEFAVVVDMSDQAPNTTVDLAVRHDTRTLAERSSRVVACDSDCEDPVPETPTRTSKPDESVVRVEQGETLDTFVSMDDRRHATYSIGGPDVNYLLNVTVTDANDDGVVLLRFHTAAAGTDEPTLTLAEPDEDALRVSREEPTLSSTLDPAEYEYRVFDGNDTTGEPVDVGTVLVTANDTAGEYEVDDTPEFGFAESVVRGRQGETVAIPVVLADAKAATVSIGSPESGYEINATLRDGNGDGRVRLLFDSAAAGRDGSTLSAAADADSVTVEPGSEVALDGRLDPSEYDLSLYRGIDTGGGPADIGTLALSEGSDAGTETPGSVTARDDIGQTNSSGVVPGAGAVALAVGGILAVAGIGVAARSFL